MAKKNGVLDELDLISKSIPQIPKDRQYWFFRTNGGEFFDTFYDKGLVAIGHNKVKLEKIYSGSGSDEAKVRNAVVAVFGKEKIGLAVSQLLRFAFEMRKGDVVIMPGYKSETLAIGIVADNEARYTPAINSICPYNKYRKVEWLLKRGRAQLDPNLTRLFNTHQTISNAEGYADWIDSAMHDLYFKKDKLNMVLRVKRKEDIHAKILHQAMVNLMELSEGFIENSSGVNIENEFNELSTKISLSSPGNLRLIGGLGIAGLLGMSILTAILVVGAGGGEADWEIGKTIVTPQAKVHVKAGSVIDKYTAYINSTEENRRKAEVISKAMKDLKIEKPKDLIEAMEAFRLEGKDTGK